jgi:hypothetical protein
MLASKGKALFERWVAWALEEVDFFEASAEVCRHGSRFAAALEAWKHPR